MINNGPGATAQFAQIRLYEELNDFLPESQQRAAFSVEFSGTPTVLEVLESVGVPQSEIDLILVGEQPVSFTHRLRGGERIAAFPVFERFDISPANRLRPRPVRRTRFVLDSELDKLARGLRLAGFDSVHNTAHDDLDVIAIATAQRRILLSRDPELLKNGRVTHGYRVRADDSPAQLVEVIETFNLRGAIKPFSRCMACNGHLRIADDDQVHDRVPFAMMVAFDEFWQCELCQKVYWKGSHYVRLCKMIGAL